MDQREYTALLRDQEWPDLHARLTTYAIRWTRAKSARQVEDLVQDAIAQVWDPEYQNWDPEREPQLLRYLMSVVNSKAWGKRTKEARRKEPRDAEKRIGKVVSPAPSPERALELAQAADRASTLMRERLGTSDEIVTEIFTLFEGEVDSAADQAQATGRRIEEIRTARKRFFRHADAIRDEIGIDLDEVDT